MKFMHDELVEAETRLRKQSPEPDFSNSLNKTLTAGKEAAAKKFLALIANLDSCKAEFDYLALSKKFVNQA